jgi:MSHA biogenesis protein MshJ
MTRLQTLMARINRATLRERSLVFAAAVVLLSTFWYQLAMLPIKARQARVAQALEELKSHAGTDGSGADANADEYAALKVREAALREAIAQADRELRDAQRGMIEPKQMVGVLTDVLERQKALNLVLLRNLPVQPLLPAAAEPKGDEAKVPESGPYLHPVELVVRGNYLDVLAYLKELEARPYGFQWRRFEYSAAEDGPEYRIQFTTLSMESNWLGV